MKKIIIITLMLSTISLAFILGYQWKYSQKESVITQSEEETDGVNVELNLKV